MSRLASLTNDLAGTANDLSITFSYNPASQIIQAVRTGDAYAYTAQGSGSTAYTSNGLNQQVTIGGAAATWDSKGNLATEPQSNKAYCYSPENLLKRVSTPAAGCTSPSATLAYDPLLRLSQVTSSGTTRFAYNGADAVAEYDGSGNLLKRFVIDPTTGMPIMEFAGSGTGTSFHRFYGADERGSIVSNSDIAGNVVGLNRYDEYGKPQSTNIGRYQYTGQKWIGEAGLYDYKARDYLPHLGIFAQTDPVGYEDSPNPYAYVLDDPINLIDPFGLEGDEAITCIGSNGCAGGIDLGRGRSSPPAVPCPGPYCITGHPRVGVDTYTGAQTVGGGTIVVTGRRKPIVVTGTRRRAGLGIQPALPSRPMVPLLTIGESNDEYERDLNICRSLSSPAARARCYGSAEARRYARENGRPLPPLIQWRTGAAITLGVILYWIVSEGSRIIFPPRNLVPVP